MPIAIIGTVAFIKEDQLKMVGGKVRVFFADGKMLNGSHQDIGEAIISVAGGTANGEGVTKLLSEGAFSLASKGVTIHKKQGALYQTERPQLRNDASGCDGLAGAGRHLQIHPTPSGVNGG